VCVESEREHPSDILEYFIPRCDVVKQGLEECLLRNYLDKHDAVNNTARALTEKGMAIIGACNLHNAMAAHSA